GWITISSARSEANRAIRCWSLLKISRFLPAFAFRYRVQETPTNAISAPSRFWKLQTQSRVISQAEEALVVGEGDSAAVEVAGDVGEGVCAVAKVAAIRVRMMTRFNICEN